MNGMLKDLFSVRLIHLAVMLSALVQLGLLFLYPPNDLKESNPNAVYRMIQLIDVQEEPSAATVSEPDEIKDVEISDTVKELAEANVPEPVEKKEPELTGEMKRRPSAEEKPETLQKTGYTAPGRGGFFSELVIDELPQIALEAPKKYPVLAREKGKEGRVVLDIYIDQEGRIADIALIQNPGYGFAEAAAEYVRGSTWLPAKYKGRSVPVRIRKPIVYSLEE